MSVTDRVLALGPVAHRKAKTAAFVVRELWTHPANQGRRVRQLVAASAFEMAGRALQYRRVVILGNSSRLWVTIPHYASVLVLQRNPPDWNEMAVWSRKLGQSSLFIDVGANIGVYTLWAQSMAPR